MRKPANRAWSQTWATGANNAPGASAALEQKCLHKKVIIFWKDTVIKLNLQ